MAGFRNRLPARASSTTPCTEFLAEACSSPLPCRATGGAFFITSDKDVGMTLGACPGFRRPPWIPLRD
jgi:hypothetical protein